MSQTAASSSAAVGGSAGTGEFARPASNGTISRDVAAAPASKAPSSAADLRDRGNAAFKAGRWREAADFYTQAIAADPLDAKAWNNRALTFLKLGDPLLAWGDSMHVHQNLEPTNVKALLRVAAAAEEMQVFEEARLAYVACLPLPLTPAERHELKERSYAGHLAKQRHYAERKDVPFVARDEVEKKAAATALAGGVVHLKGSFRAGSGDPRDPAAVIAMMTPLLTESCVALHAIEGKGVGVVATRDIPAGTLIHTETPLLAVSMDGESCYHCLRRLPAANKGAQAGAPRGVACSGGCDRRYCSSDCEMAAAALYHGPLCGQAGGNAVGKMETYCSAGVTASSRFPLLMWKMLGWALTQSRKAGTPLLPPADAPPFVHLARISDWQTPDAGDRIMPANAANPMRTWGIMRTLLDTAISNEPALSIGWVSSCIAVLGANLLGLRARGRTSFLAMGAGLMGAGSMFNHSCVPNTHDVSDMDATGSTVRFYTQRAVRKGEELTIAYFDPGYPLESRQMFLDAQYGFKCTCPKCTAQSP